MVEDITEKTLKRKPEEEQIEENTQKKISEKIPWRKKAEEMLYSRLKCEEESNKTKELVSEIEEEIFKACTDAEYRKKIRALCLGLSINKELVEKIWKKEITPRDIAEMHEKDMATEKRKEEDDLIQIQNLKKTIISKDEVPETDQFKCGKCHQRKTTYYQLQTRSADEPMTTFVSCITCGNKWKFS